MELKSYINENNRSFLEGGFNYEVQLLRSNKRSTDEKLSAAHQRATILDLGLRKVGFELRM